MISAVGKITIGWMGKCVMSFVCPTSCLLDTGEQSSLFQGFLTGMVYLYNDIVHIYDSGRKPRNFSCP